MAFTWPLATPFAPTGSVTQASLDLKYTEALNELYAMFLVTTSGFVNVTIATAGTPVGVAITFPAGMFATTPRVVASVVNTSTPQNRAASAGSITNTGCTIFGWSTTTGTIVVHWIATLS